MKLLFRLVCEDCHGKSQRNDVASAIFNVIAHNIAFFCIGNLLLAFLLTANLEGLAVNLEVADARADNILGDSHLIIEECLTDIAYVGCLSA